MDFSNYGTEKSNDGAVMEVRDEATGLIYDGVTVTLKGTDSEVFRNYTQAKTQRRINSGKKEKFDAEANEKETLKLLAMLTVETKGIEFNKKAVEQDLAGFVDMYKRLPWLRDQADRFIGDRANFLPSA